MRGTGGCWERVEFLLSDQRAQVPLQNVWHQHSTHLLLTVCFIATVFSGRGEQGGGKRELVTGAKLLLL